MSNYINCNLNGNYTFQNSSFSMPPPPLFSRPPIDSNVINQHIIKQLENKVRIHFQSKWKPHNSLTISMTKKKLQQIISQLNEIKEENNVLKENIETLPEDKWREIIDNVEKKYISIQKLMIEISSNLEILRKLIAKRSAKRMRIKRRNSEMKIENQNRLKELAERSRKIDENLQKARDDIARVKQDEQEKLNADVFLKEVLRKKHDASKCTLKLDALLKLHKARCNTTKGRGQQISEVETKAFNENIEKLKSLWSQKLAIYEKEENDLRAKLKMDSDISKSAKNVMEAEITQNMRHWRRFLFGAEEAIPQADFQQDIDRFIASRAKWDQYISDAGTALPFGWVLPSK